LDSVGAPIVEISRLNSPACTCPCQRFATPSRVVDAWPGAAVGRQPFDVELFHLLLHAGLSRRFPKTAQKHDYPSAAWRRSYARRTGAERGFATAKDPATNDISRGWCRLMGLAPLMLFTTTLLIVRNQRILTAWTARQEENERRAAQGLPPKTRRRRRTTLTALTTATRPP
jgi:hypothetical protein